MHGLRVRKRRRTSAGKCPSPDSDPLNDAELGKNLARLSRQVAASTNRRFQFHKRGQLLIGMYHETLTIIAMRVHNPDCSLVAIHC
jgi:hypothetical protein